MIVKLPSFFKFISNSVKRIPSPDKTSAIPCKDARVRIFVNIGSSFNLNDVKLWIGPYEIFSDGRPLAFDREIVSKFMKARLKGKYLIDDLISIRLRLGAGNYSATAWGCDLSDQYVRINADYTT